MHIANQVAHQGWRQATKVGRGGLALFARECMALGTHYSKVVSSEGTKPILRLVVSLHGYVLYIAQLLLGVYNTAQNEQYAW